MGGHGDYTLGDLDGALLKADEEEAWSGRGEVKSPECNTRV